MVTDAGYLAQIHESAVLAHSVGSAPAVVDHVRAQLTDLLQLRGCRFEYGTLLGRPPRLEHDGSIVVGRRTWATDQLGMPAEEVELRLFGNGRYIGRFMLDPIPGSIPTRQALLVAVTLTDQAGRAMDALSRPVKVA
ncbi:hypothetical protein [Streptomyces sp. NBC_01431]|uniref:hypothetical protein n=1 Tax=Streptomyces sp. NBC_01431 TaxID=2903863 RepID=UPI002E357A87|nr:hypothetical protein [Streptomyces sp. NBC_01431]